MYNTSTISIHPHLHTQIVLSYTFRELQTSDPTTERRWKDTAFVCPPSSSSSGTDLAHSTLSSSHHCVHSCLVFIALSAVIHHAGWFNTHWVWDSVVCVWVVFIVNTSPSGSNNYNRLSSYPISFSGTKQQLIAPQSAGSHYTLYNKFSARLQSDPSAMLQLKNNIPAPRGLFWGCCFGC